MASSGAAWSFCMLLFCSSETTRVQCPDRRWSYCIMTSPLTPLTRRVSSRRVGLSTGWRRRRSWSTPSSSCGALPRERRREPPPPPPPPPLLLLLPVVVTEAGHTPSTTASPPACRRRLGSWEPRAKASGSERRRWTRRLSPPASPAQTRSPASGGGGEPEEEEEEVKARCRAQSPSSGCWGRSPRPPPLAPGVARRPRDKTRSRRDRRANRVRPPAARSARLCGGPGPDPPPRDLWNWTLLTTVCSSHPPAPRLNIWTSDDASPRLYILY